jgi:hypothetical protein
MSDFAGDQTYNVGSLVRGIRSTDGEKTDNFFYEAVLATLREAGVNPKHPLWTVVTHKVQTTFKDAGAETDLERLKQYQALGLSFTENSRPSEVKTLSLVEIALFLLS